MFRLAASGARVVRSCSGNIDTGRMTGFPRLATETGFDTKGTRRGPRQVGGLLFEVVMPHR
jgi:hypothetical protein